MSDESAVLRRSSGAGKVAILLTVLLASSCAGTQSSIRAPGSGYPVSLSGAVRDAHGRVLSGDDLVEVGTFSHAYTSRHMFFTLVALENDEVDLSEEIDRQVEEAQGEAVVNLSVTAHYSIWTPFTVTLFGVGGILPVHADVEVSGDIVKRNREVEPGAEPAQVVPGLPESEPSP